MTPPVPSAPIVAQSGYNSVQMSWRKVLNLQQNNTGAMQYLIFRDGIQIAKIKDNDYSDVGLTDGGTYSYTVAAIDNTGTSPLSVATSITLIKQITAKLLGGLILIGPGSPINTVPANPGTLWLRSDGGTNTTLYSKESGIATSGW